MPAAANFAEANTNVGADYSQELLGIDPVRMLQMVEDACTLITECRDEMGIILGNPEPKVNSWAWRRRCARSEYAGSFLHRRSLGGYFEAEGGNLSLAIPARFVRLLYSKLSDDLCGTDPFLAIMPAKVSDKDQDALSKQVETKVQDEISKSNLRTILDESIRVALTENERPVKLAWTTEKTQRPELRPVAIFPIAQVEVPAAVPGSEFLVLGSEGEQPEVSDAGPRRGVGPGRADGADMTGVQEGKLEASTTTEGEPVALQPSTENPATRTAPVPIKTPAGNYIFERDDFILTLVDVATGAHQGLYVPGSEIPEGMAVQTRLKKEPSFLLDASMLGPDGKPIYAVVPGLVGTDVHKDQLEAFGLKMEDFIYDIKAATLDHSDIQCHVYDEDLDDVLAAYRVESDPGPRYEEIAKKANLVRNITATSPQSGASQGITDAGERYGSNGSSVRKVINVHETYYRVRIHPSDPYKTWLFLVIDFNRRVPLHAEYLGNMRLRKPPVRLLRGLESEPGRAYGVGVYQKFADRNLAIDFWFNRSRLKTTKEASADFMFPDAFQNSQDAQAFVLGSKIVYPLKPDANGERWSESNPPVFRKNLHEANDKEWEVIEKLIQSGQLEFGMSSIGDLAASGAGIAEGGTATATRNIERTGNLVQRSTENMMARDMTEICQMAVEIILENTDLPAQEFTPGGELLAGLNRDEIRELPRDVRLLLTKARSAESLETNTQVKTTIAEYYSMPKWLQQKSRFAYINILKSLDVQDADEVLTEPTEEEIKAEADAAAKPEDEPGPSIAIPFEQLTPSEQGKVLMLAGIEPDPNRAAFVAARTEAEGSHAETQRRGEGQTEEPAAGPEPAAVPEGAVPIPNLPPAA